MAKNVGIQPIGVISCKSIGRWIKRVILISVVLTACSSQPTIPPVPPTPDVPSVPYTPTFTPEASPTAISTLTLVPTSTSTPTMTSTPTLALPVLEGTAAPERVGAIVPGNVKRIREVARWGKGAINGIAWSPDGKYIALATALGIYLYDSQSLSQVQFVETEQPALGVDFSADGSMLAAAAGNVFVWALQDENLKEIRTFQDPKNALCFDFSPDGSRIAIGSSDGKVRLWSFQGNYRQELVGHGWSVKSVVFSPDGQVLSSVGFGTFGNSLATQSSLFLWLVEDGSLIKKLTGHEGFIYKLAMSGDGALLAAGTTEHKVLLWSVPGGVNTRSLAGHTGQVTSVAASADGSLLASGGFDNTVRLWHLPDGKFRFSLEGHTDQIVGMAFSPDSQKVATASWDGTLKIWNTQDGSLLQTLDGHPGPFETMDISPDGKMAALVGQAGFEGSEIISRNRIIRVLDAVSGSIIQKLEIEDNIGVSQAVFSPDGKLLAAHTENVIQIWQVADWKPVLVFKSKGINDMDFSPDSSALAYSQEFIIRILQISDSKIIAQMEREKSNQTFGEIDFSPVGDVLTGISTGSIFTWDTTTGALIHDKLEGCVWVFVKFTPDGQNIITASPLRCYNDHHQPNTLILWQYGTGTIIWTREMNAGYPWGNEGNRIAFSADGKILATAEGSSEIIQLRSLFGGEIIQTLSGHNHWIRGLAFTPNRKYLISAARDGTIRVWGVP